MEIWIVEKKTSHNDNPPTRIEDDCFCDCPTMTIGAAKSFDGCVKLVEESVALDQIYSHNKSDLIEDESWTGDAAVVCDGHLLLRMMEYKGKDYDRIRTVDAVCYEAFRYELMD